MLKAPWGVQGPMERTLEYTEKEAKLEEAIYETQEARSRRQLVREELDVSPGEKVLSLGCGPGYEPAEIAEEVGPMGHVRAIDRSEPMLDLARAKCDGLPQVTILEGDAVDLSVDDCAFDAATAVQVLEYVEDVQAALAELFRVLRPGGRAIIYDTDYDSLVWRSSNAERNKRVLDSLGKHCPRPHLGSELTPLIQEAGFHLEDVEPNSILNTRLNEDTFAYQLMRSHREYVSNRGIVDESEADAWVDDLIELEEEGGSFFNLTQYLHLVRKPSAKESTNRS